MKWKIIAVAGIAVIAAAILIISVSAHPGQWNGTSNSSPNGQYYSTPGHYEGFEGERGGYWRPEGPMNGWGPYGYNYNGTFGYPQGYGWAGHE